MKKPSESNTGVKKQLVSGAVYIALAVTVVAVTVSTITATFSGQDRENNPVKNGDTLYNSDYELRLPDTNLGNIVPDTAVSDVEQGVVAKVTEPESNGDNAEDKQENPATEEKENKDANAVQELLEPEAAEQDSGEADENQNQETDAGKGEEKASDRTKPFSEEPAEETFELGYGGYIKPCSGYIIKEFSVEMPVYSATMYDYRTHSGVDIACDIGTPVKAVTNGFIRDVYDDYMFGTTVVIEHADGVCSVYSNLSPDLPADTVIGRSVMTGEVIGGVGESALCESSEVSHLHFEMLKGTEHVDPEDYI